MPTGLSDLMAAVALVGLVASTYLGPVLNAAWAPVQTIRAIYQRVDQLTQPER